MKTVKVEITGQTPLLMNNPKSMIDSAKSSVRQTTKKYDLDEDAERLAYKKKSGELYVPSAAIKGTIVNAASYKKIGKYAAKPIIAGGVFIMEEELGLKTKKYNLDIRTVVIQKARVVKARPKVDKWKLAFELRYNEKMIGDSLIIKDILDEAGERVGILDFRPQKLGSFGMFKVTKWQEK